MAYDLNTLKTSYENAKENEAYYSIFFVEAEKYIRAILPSAPLTAKLYGEATKYFSETYDLEDLIQDCLLKLWEYIVELKLYHADGITTYLTTAARYVLFNFVKKESRRSKIATFRDLSEAETTPYFDNFDEEELSEAAEKYEAYEPGNKKTEDVIVQVDKKTYECLAEYKTVSEAAEDTGINRTNISEALSGKRKTAGGFIWVKHDHPLLGTIKKNV